MAASLPSMAVSSHRGWAWYLLITVQWLSLLTKAFRWDISAVSSCGFEKRFVNCHFELNIQRILTTTWHLRQITSPVFTHPVVSEPCPLCSEAIHSSYTKWKPTCFESMTCWPFSTSLLILWKQAIMTYHVAKKMIASRAVALLHFSSHWLPGDREFRVLTRWASIWTMPNTASPKSEPPCGRVVYTPVRATILGHPPQKTATGGFTMTQIYLMKCSDNSYRIYCQTFNISCTLVGNYIIDHSGVIGALPVGAAPTTSSLWKDNCKARRETFTFCDLVQLISEIWWYFPC